MYDFIIVGGGSAGCVLANRLSRDPAHQVLLLEAGPSDDTPLVRAPMGMVKLYESEVFNWLFGITITGRRRVIAAGATAIC